MRIASAIIAAIAIPSAHMANIVVILIIAQHYQRNSRELWNEEHRHGAEDDKLLVNFD